MSIRLKYLKTKIYIKSWFNIYYWRSLRGDFLRWNRRRKAYKKLSSKSIKYAKANFGPPLFKRKRDRIKEELLNTKRSA